MLLHVFLGLATLAIFLVEVLPHRKPKPPELPPSEHHEPERFRADETGIHRED